MTKLLHLIAIKPFTFLVPETERDTREKTKEIISERSQARIGVQDFGCGESHLSTV
jgi:uncharacterized phosphosugar-binding protein